MHNTAHTLTHTHIYIYIYVYNVEEGILNNNNQLKKRREEKRRGEEGKTSQRWWTLGSSPFFRYYCIPLYIPRQGFLHVRLRESRLKLEGGKKGITRSSTRTKEPRKHKNEARGDIKRREMCLASTRGIEALCVGDQSDLFPTPPKEEKQKWKPMLLLAFLSDIYCTYVPFPSSPSSSSSPWTCGTGRK